MSADDTASDMQLGDAGTVAGASEAVTVSVSAPPPSAAERARQVKFAARSALSKQIAKRSPRDASGRFRRTRPQPPPPPKTDKRTRSRVSNRKQLFLTGPAHSPAGRRLHDILQAVIADMGGADNMSEAERQVSRRGACLAVVCERLEETICNNGAALEPAADGVNPHVILRQAGKVLNAIALAKGGHTVGELAKLPADQLAVVTDLLTRAGDLSSRAITAENGVLELYGLMADRCSRTFQRIGLQRRPRDLTELAAYASEQSFSPLRQQMRDEATDAETVEEVSEAAE